MKQIDGQSGTRTSAAPRPVGALIGLALALAAAAPAQATLVSGKYDPVFGGTSALAGLYFNGTETFTLADSCLGLSGFVPASGSCGGAPAGMRFDGATVNFYSANPATDPAAVLLGSTAFAGDGATFLNPILGMYVANGQVLGVQSLVIGQAAIDLNGGHYLLDIQFGRTDLSFGPSSQVGEYNGGTFTSLAQLPADALTTLFIDPGPSPSSTNPCNISGLASGCVRSQPAATSYITTSVPEPGPVSLLLLGLGLLAWRCTAARASRSSFQFGL